MCCSALTLADRPQGLPAAASGAQLRAWLRLHWCRGGHVWRPVQSAVHTHRDVGSGAAVRQRSGALPDGSQTLLFSHATPSGPILEPDQQELPHSSTMADGHIRDTYTQSVSVARHIVRRADVVIFADMSLHDMAPALPQGVQAGRSSNDQNPAAPRSTRNRQNVLRITCCVRCGRSLVAWRPVPRLQCCRWSIVPLTLSTQYRICVPGRSRPTLAPATCGDTSSAPPLTVLLCGASSPAHPAAGMI